MERVMCILAVDFYVEEESHPYCVEIEKSPKKTKKLRFGPAQLLKKIEFLSSQEGYCWAEDKYFAQEFDVDISTINRWIRTLKELELIKTESKNVLTANGWIRRRKTYVLKKSLRNPQNKGSGTLNVEGSINKHIKEEEQQHKEDVVVSFSHEKVEKVSLDPDPFHLANINCLKFHFQMTDAEVIESLKVISSNGRFNSKQINDKFLNFLAKGNYSIKNATGFFKSALMQEYRIKGMETVLK